MFVAKSQKLARLLAGVCQYWRSAVLRHASVRRLVDGEYRKTSIPNNDVHPPVVRHGHGFVIEDSCRFKVKPEICVYEQIFKIFRYEFDILYSFY